MIQPRDVTPEVISALNDLRELRHRIRTGLIDSSMISDLLHAITVLEEVGVFAEIDEVIDNERVVDLLVESAAGDLAELHGARDHEVRAPLTYLRAIRRK